MASTQAATVTGATMAGQPRRRSSLRGMTTIQAASGLLRDFGASGLCEVPAWRRAWPAGLGFTPEPIQRRPDSSRTTAACPREERRRIGFPPGRGELRGSACSPESHAGFEMILFSAGSLSLMCHVPAWPSWRQCGAVGGLHGRVGSLG